MRHRLSRRSAHAHASDRAGARAALQWLRRRGPAMPEGARRKLARERKLRLAEGNAARRVAPGALLPPGARLLIPRGAAAPQAAPARPPPPQSAALPCLHA